jgi:hypothetical protein
LWARLTSPGLGFVEPPNQPDIGNRITRCAERPVRAEGVAVEVPKARFVTNYALFDTNWLRSSHLTSN